MCQMTADNERLAATFPGANQKHLRASRWHAVQGVSGPRRAANESQPVLTELAEVATLNLHEDAVHRRVFAATGINVMEV